MRKRLIAGVGIVLVLGIIGAACSEKAKTKATTPSASATSAASDLRVTLDSLLREHVFLAALATGDALAGQTKAFTAAAASLDANSVGLSKAIGSVFGADAETAFLPLWRSHINFVVNYTTGLAAKDKAKQDKAVSDLLGYTRTFGVFINGALPALPADAVAGLVKTHILGLKDVIDDQAAKDFVKADAALREAADHMGMIASALADAIVKKFPAQFA